MLSQHFDCPELESLFEEGMDLIEKLYAGKSPARFGSEQKTESPEAHYQHIFVTKLKEAADKITKDTSDISKDDILFDSSGGSAFKKKLMG